MPSVTHTFADPHDPLPAPVNDPIWLDPLPETYFVAYLGNPESDYEVHESLTLAFLTALQELPGRQRAVLILRDVLGWKARIVADLLDTSVPAVNSALQRARATMKKHQQGVAARPDRVVDSEQTAALLARYVHAWEADDSTRLIALLREDAVLTMPPLPAWYRGTTAIKRFLDTYLFTGESRGRFRLIATRANGCPAFAVYERDETGTYRISALHILTIASDQIVQIDDFLALDDRLFARFKLPLPD